MAIGQQQHNPPQKIRLVRDDIVAGEDTYGGQGDLTKSELINGDQQRSTGKIRGLRVAIELSFMNGLAGEPDCFYVEITTGNYIPLERTRWRHIGDAREHWRTGHTRLPELIALYALGALTVPSYPETPIR